MIVRVLGLLLVAALAASPVQAELPGFTGLIEANSPAVVKIKATEKAPERRRQQIPQDQLPDIFRDFFGDRFGDGGRQRQRPSAMGSGFFISSDGYILTNNHVIGDADEITVRLIDRREFTAEVVGVDPRSDLALLKIDATGLPKVKLAAPGDLKVGEWVVAIGS
ncbi:MAG TPA: serine peptidase, partial [Porticoccaceae bacterium]|nr:serine peptidase [Porticoccaceae bacterium]